MNVVISFEATLAAATVTSFNSVDLWNVWLESMRYSRSVPFQIILLGVLKEFPIGHTEY